MSGAKSTAQLGAEVAAALLKDELEGAGVGAKVTVAKRDTGALVTIEHPESRFRETIAFTRYGATPVEACPFQAPRPFMTAMNRALARAKKLVR